MVVSASTRLGPYEILATIGRGGMGEVWKARDTRLGRDVAIKISAEQFSERFEREARTVAALNHPNICTLHDVGSNYLVMEFIEGATLAERIKEGPIPLDEALSIARHVADALDAAHEAQSVIASVPQFSGSSFSVIRPCKQGPYGGSLCPRCHAPMRILQRLTASELLCELARGAAAIDSS